MLFKRFNFPSVSLLDIFLIQRNGIFLISKFSFLGSLSFTFTLNTLFTSKFFLQKQSSFYFIKNVYNTNFLSFNLLKMFSNLFSLQSMSCNGHFSFLYLNGVGFRLFLNKIDSVLKIEFGASHAVFISLSPRILSFARGSFVFFFSMVKSVFFKFIFLLKFLKKKDPYKGKGFLFQFELPAVKKGKVRN